MNLRALLTVLLLLPAAASAAESLDCFVGPVQLRIGHGDWQVTSCSDGRSIVFATAAGNPAMPFVFIVRRSGTESRISGEGNGSKEASAAAFEQIKSVTEKQLDALVEVTKMVKPKSRRLTSRCSPRVNDKVAKPQLRSRGAHGRCWADGDDR
jgi:hypothetical protein